MRMSQTNKDVKLCVPFHTKYSIQDHSIVNTKAAMRISTIVSILSYLSKLLRYTVPYLLRFAKKIYIYKSNLSDYDTNQNPNG